MVNVAELLKDCPKGMELDCAMYETVTLNRVLDGLAYPIRIETPDGLVLLNEYGCYSRNEHAKCIIFPKGKTTWEGFVPPVPPGMFEDGDILTDKMGNIFIYKGPMYYDKNLADYYCGYRIIDRAFIFKKFKDNHFGDINKLRLASEIEKQHFFQILLDNGYKWNSKTKTLEKLIVPKFKIGDRIKLKNSPSNIICTVTKINDDGSICVNGYTWVIKYELQDKYELVPKKFDITTLKPLESKVLMRSSNAREWVGTIYSHYNKKFYGCGMCCDQCIPYEGNEHLLGTTNDCDEYYKTW